MKKSILLLAVLTFYLCNSQAQTVYDIDSNGYNTVTIGKQIWLKENLKVRHYRNGDSIPYITATGSVWSNLDTGAYGVYNNNPVFADTFGCLYNYFAVIDTRGLCPIGWHVPTENEWIKLVTFLGGEVVAGAKMKETGLAHWNTPNTEATNTSGFTALAGGVKDYSDGASNYLGEFAFFLSTTEKDITNAKYYRLTFNRSNVNNYGIFKQLGASVRCLSDSTITEINDLKNNFNLQLFPNPAADRVFISSNIDQNLKMQLFNSVGQCILQKEFNIRSTEIDLSTLSKGIYIMKFIRPNGTLEKKLLIK